MCSKIELIHYERNQSIKSRLPVRQQSIKLAAHIVFGVTILNAHAHGTYVKLEGLAESNKWFLIPSLSPAAK